MRENLKVVASIIFFVLLLALIIWFHGLASCDWIAYHMPYAPLPARCFNALTGK